MTGMFGDRVATAVGVRRSQLLLGLDPDPLRLWPRALEPAGGAEEVSAPPRLRVAGAVRRHCELVLEAVADACVGVKFQLACFERLGADGWQALEDLVATARGLGLLVIADGKRGDIDVSARAYASAFLGETETPAGPLPGLGADALTINPLLGGDSLAPFVDVARPRGRGLFVLTRTSNPGSRDLQEQALAGGGDVSTRVAAMIAELGEAGTGESGLSDVGAVVGATAPERLEELRALLPAAIFLLPGVGAQGGRVEDLAPAFSPGPGGGLVTVSRGIVFAHERSGGPPAEAARAEAERLRELAWRLTA